MEKICYSMGAFDKDAAELLYINPSTCTEKHCFFARIIKLYSKNHVYCEVNKSLRQQSLQTSDSYKITADDYALGPYMLFLDVLLFYWDELAKVSTITYRGAYLEDDDMQMYTEDTWFVWLNFVSSSKSREIVKGFPGNVLFEITMTHPKWSSGALEI